METAIFDGFPYSPLALSHAIMEAYQKLYTATREVGIAQEALVEAQAALRESRNEILVKYKPADLGANETARDATMRTMAKDEYQAVADAEDQLRMQMDNQRITQQKVESLRAQLRIMEMVVAAETITKGGKSDATGF